MARRYSAASPRRGEGGGGGGPLPPSRCGGFGRVVLRVGFWCGGTSGRALVRWCGGCWCHLRRWARCGRLRWLVLRTGDSVARGRVRRHGTGVGPRGWWWCCVGWGSASSLGRVGRWGSRCGRRARVSGIGRSVWGRVAWGLLGVHGAEVLAGRPRACQLCPVAGVQGVGPAAWCCAGAVVGGGFGRDDTPDAMQYSGRSLGLGSLFAGALCRSADEVQVVHLAAFVVAALVGE